MGFDYDFRNRMDADNIFGEIIYPTILNSHKTRVKAFHIRKNRGRYPKWLEQITVDFCNYHMPDGSTVSEHLLYHSIN